MLRLCSTWWARSALPVEHIGRGMLEYLAADGQSLIGGHETDQILALADLARKKFLDQGVDLRTFLDNAIEQMMRRSS